MAYFADLTAHHKNMKVNDRELGVIIYQTVFKQLLNMKVIWDQRPEYGSVVQQSGFSSWMGSKGPQRLVLWGFQWSSLLALWSPRPKKLLGLRLEPYRGWSTHAQEMVIKAGNGTSAMFFCVIQPNELRWPGGWGWLTGRFCRSGHASSASDSLQPLADQRTCPDMSWMWCLPNAINHPIYQPWLEIILHYPIIPVIGCHRVYIYIYVCVCVCVSTNQPFRFLPHLGAREGRHAIHIHPLSHWPWRRKPKWVEMIGGRNGLMMENHPATWGMTKPSPGMDESVAGKIHG